MFNIVAKLYVWRGMLDLKRALSGHVWTMKYQ